MNSFLCKTFIKNFDNCKDPQVRKACGRFAGIVGIISNVFLCVAKIIIGVISGSIAIVGDGINNLADASSSLITLIGFKLSEKPGDDDHPYGHARYEYITGMIVSVLIVVVGLELFKTSIQKIFAPSDLDVSIPAIIILVAAILIKFWQSRFNIFLGKKIDSVTLTATGTDSRNDVITTSAVLISILVQKFSGAHIDGYMGCIVAGFIIFSGIQLIRETASPLLGESPDSELVAQIMQMARSYDGVLGTHDLVVHNYGPGRIFASIHIEVNAESDLMASHDLIDNIEKDLSDSLGIELIAHLDPINLNDPIRSKVSETIEREIASIEGVTNVHDLRVIHGPTHTNIIFDVLVSSTCLLTNDEIQSKVQASISAIDPSYYIVINFDHSYLKNQ